MTHTVTIPANRLAELLAGAVPFAGTDTARPALVSVRLEARGGWVTATATDRYVAGQVRRETSPDFLCDLPPTLLPLAAAKEIVAAAKRVKIGFATLAVTDGRLFVELPGSRAEYLLLDAKYPRLDGIVSTFAKPVHRADRPVALAGDLLAKIAKVAGKRAVLFFVFDATKAVHFTIGDDVRGVVHPIRIGEDTAADGPTVPWGLDG